MRTIYNYKWYTPKEVAALGLIRSPHNPDSFDASYRFIIHLIKQGLLPAKQWGKNPEKQPRYLVSEKAIVFYNEVRLVDVNNYTH